MYSIIGQILYSGMIKKDDPNAIANAAGNELYYQLNFNDAVSGLLTLFCILTSNNWNSTTAMYVDQVGTTGPYWFFSFYFVLSIMVMLNIIISCVMEVYSFVLKDSEPNLAKEKHMT